MGNREHGLIAQDVQKVFPEMVREIDTENGYLRLSYIQMIPELVEATKEHQEMIDHQDAEISNLKAINASLEAKLQTQNADLKTKLEAIIIVLGMDN